jgi:general stress protein 26
MAAIAAFADLEAEFIERAHSIVWCNVATIDTRNRPRSRVLHPIWEGSTGWIATGRTSLKAKHLAHNAYVSLAYVADPMHPVYAECTAVWEEDPATKARIWELFKSTPPPLGYDPAPFFGGVESPGYGLLKLTPWRVEMGDLFAPENWKIWQA